MARQQWPQTGYVDTTRGSSRIAVEQSVLDTVAVSGLTSLRSQVQGSLEATADAFVDVLLARVEFTFPTETTGTAAPAPTDTGATGDSSVDFGDLKLDRSYTAVNTSGKLKALKYIVVHHTGPGKDENLAEYLAGGNSRGVSVQFVVGRDGHVWMLVDDIMTKCHHAGKSSWKGDTSLNQWSVGIEICNDGGKDDKYPEAQLVAVDKVIAYIDSKVASTPEIVAHRDIAPGRKDDPLPSVFPTDNYKKYRAHKKPETGTSSPRPNLPR